MILQGNSIRIPLKDESVHAIVTSFPYFGLRSYDLPPTVWGGDSGCRHIWGLEGKIKNTPPRDHNGANGFADTRGTEPHRAGTTLEASTGQLCQLCGAWLGCFGLEPSISLHVQNAVAVCREIKRVLKKTGVFYLNYGDSYATGKNGRSAADTKAVGKDDRTFRDKPFSITELPAKNLCGIPWRVALALQDDGWVLRSEIPWLKANAMPSSVTDRPGTAHEHVFMLVKSARYYFDMQAVRRPSQDSTIQRYKTGWNGNEDRGFPDGPQNHISKFMANPDAKQKAIESGRALRTSDPFFDSLDAYIAHLQDVRDNGGMLVDSEGLPAALVVNTAAYAQSHFATFPPKLIAPLIKTTPEKVCPNCQEPWWRVVEKRLENVIETRPDRGVPGRVGNGHQKTRAGDGVSITTGWQPACKCIQKRAPNFGMKGSELLELADEVIKELAPIGGIILDPFCGSGTCGQVARELGRRFIGIDLSARYLAENALARSEKKTSRKSLEQLPMFAESADEMLSRFIEKDEAA